MGVLAVVVNPRALRHRRDRGTTLRLARMVGGDGVVEETQTLEHLERVARSLRRSGVDHVAVSGGDGTIGTTLSALRRAWDGQPLPRITPLRGGTMNTISNGLGMPSQPPERLLAALLQARAGRRDLVMARRPTLLVDDHRVACLFGTGVGYGFLAEYYDAGASRPGPFVAAGTLARLAGSALIEGPAYRRAVNRIPMEVRFRPAMSDPGPGGSPEPGAAPLGTAPPGAAPGSPSGGASPAEAAWPAQPYLGVLAGTVDAVGLGFHPFHLLRGRPGTGFHLLGLHGPARRVVARLPRAWAGRPLGDDCALDALVEEARLSLASGEDVRWFADGDLGRSRGVAIVTRGPEVTFVWPGRASSS